MLYEQGSLDGLAVDAKGTTLDFTVHQYPDTATAGLGREEVLRLHAALGEWLYPVHTPEGPNRSLIEHMIERNVRQQITAILPLHLRTVATVGRCVNCAHGRKDHGAGFSTACDCGRCSNFVENVETDPEPNDVGHPEPAKPHRVSPADCLASDCDREHTAGPHGRLMSELPRRTRPRLRNPIPTHSGCVECLHGWGEHTGGICWGEHAGNHCTCTRERPETEALRKQIQEQAAPPPCVECGHGYPEHDRTGCLSVIGGSRGVECTCPRYRSTP